MGDKSIKILHKVMRVLSRLLDANAITMRTKLLGSQTSENNRETLSKNSEAFSLRLFERQKLDRKLEALLMT